MNLEATTSQDFEHAQEVLDRHLGILDSIFLKHREGVLIANLAGVIVSYNEAQSKMDGVKREEAINRTICEVYNIASNCSPTMKVLRTAQPTFDDVHFYRTRSGNLINSACHIYPLFLEDTFCGALSFISEYSFLEVEAINPPEKVPLMAKSPGKEISHTKVNQKAEGYRFSNIIGKSVNLLEAVKIAKLASKTPSSIMLIGETGVGKEMFARSIHSASPRSDKPFTAINCAAIPETLLEGIMFGTAKGAYTGAVDKPGLLQISDGGTVFFDEMDSMPLSLQSKLLRVLQDFTVRRVGDINAQHVDLKIISAVGRDPQECINTGELRKDLFYRLGVVQVIIPPLRQRKEDIPLLVQFFINKHSKLLEITPPRIRPEVMAILYAYNWQGNVRELEHVIEACLNMAANKSEIGLKDIKRMCPSIYTASMNDLIEGSLGFREQIPISIRCSLQEEEGLYPGCYPTPFLKDLCSPVAREEFQPLVAVPERTAEEVVFSKLGEGLLESKESLEIQAIKNALSRSSGNKSLAARLLNISPQLIGYKIKKFGIEADDFIPR